MGFLQVVNGGEMDAEKLARFWGNSSPSRIENGGKVIVRRNEVLVQLSGNEAVDVIAEAGGYIYHSDIGANPDTEAYAEAVGKFLEGHSGFFGSKEIVILPCSQRITSPEQLKRVLLESAGEIQPEPQSAPAKNIAPKSGTWICKCGTENEYGFCKRCGSARPQNSEANTEYKPTYTSEPKPQAQSAANVPPKANVVWICGKCGTRNEYSFCKKCGSPCGSPHRSEAMQNSSYIVMECPHCGADLKRYPNVKFCPKCGNKTS